jgi:hypothetical protein
MFRFRSMFRSILRFRSRCRFGSRFRFILLFRLRSNIIRSMQIQIQRQTPNSDLCSDSDPCSDPHSKFRHRFRFRLLFTFRSNVKFACCRRSARPKIKHPQAPKQNKHSANKASQQSIPANHLAPQAPSAWPTKHPIKPPTRASKKASQQASKRRTAHKPPTQASPASLQAYKHIQTQAQGKPIAYPSQAKILFLFVCFFVCLFV